MTEITIREILPGSINSQKEIKGDMIYVRRSASSLTNINLPDKTGEYETDAGIVRLDLRNIRTDEQLRERLHKHLEKQRAKPFEKRKEYRGWVNKLVIESELIGEGEREVVLDKEGAGTIFQDKDKTILVSVFKAKRHKTLYQINTADYRPNSTTLWR